MHWSDLLMKRAFAHYYTYRTRIFDQFPWICRVRRGIIQFCYYDSIQIIRPIQCNNCSSPDMFQGKSRIGFV